MEPSNGSQKGFLGMFRRKPKLKDDPARKDMVWRQDRARRELERIKRIQEARRA